MIEINIHIPIDKPMIDSVSVPVLLPVVPRVGEKIYLSDTQRKGLLCLLEETGACSKQESQSWEKAIKNFINVEEVAYNAKDGTIHIELSTI